MKKLLIVSLLALAVPVISQDASYNTPVVRPSETKVVVRELNITLNQVVVSLSIRTAADAEVSYYNVTVPNSAVATQNATVVGFITAIGTARSGETGSVQRRFNFRVLGYLSDQGYLPGLTVNP